MTDFLQDLRFAVRWMKKSPGFTLVAVLTLALGIGANTAIFSVMNAVVLQQLPYKDPGQLVQLWESSGDNHQIQVSGVDFLDWREQNKTFSHMALFTSGNTNVSHEKTALREVGAYVTSDFFAVLGVNATVGRELSPSDHAENATDVINLSEKLRGRLFGTEQNVLGKTVKINGKPYVISGITPAALDFPARAEFWVPLRDQSAKSAGSRSAKNYRAIGRLKPGVTIQEASADLAVIADRIAKTFPDEMKDLGVQVNSLHEQIVGKVRPVLVIFFWTVVFVLLIACVNVANLLLARANSRSREMAIRTALGASRWRLLRQLLTESVLLALSAGALGLVAMFWGVRLLRGFIPREIPRIEHVTIDAHVLGFTMLISLATGIIFGLLPSLHATKIDVNETLKGAMLGMTRQRIAGWLVTGEIGLALLLLVGAGLLIKSFWKLQHVDVGYRPEKLLTAKLSLPTGAFTDDYERAAAAHTYVRQIVGRVSSIPGVESAATINSLLSDQSNGSGGIEGRSVGDFFKPTFSVWHADYQVVSPGYFRTMGIKILRGRDLSEADDENHPEAMIINEAAARKYWPNGDPVGARVIFPGMKKTRTWVTIVGVAADVHQRGMDQTPLPAAFTPHAQNQFHATYATLVARVRADDPATVTAIKNKIHEVSDELPVEIEAASTVLSESLARQRFQTNVLTIFALVALVLAAIGIYGVFSYVVEQRTREIGIRMALGAQREDILWLFVERGLKLGLMGLALGAVASLITSRVLATYLFNVTATDPFVFSVTSCILFVIAIFATYLPARRASSAEPSASLRYE